MPTTPLAMKEVRKRLKGTPRWKLVRGRRIRRELRFKDFAQAMKAVARVAKAAEAYGHHPDILVYSWNRVRLDLTTHDAGYRLSRWDFEMAKRLDRVLPKTR
ncbi:MAG: 4a-hydroxytetrahydrobiopterin dehydratase [Methanobacteriota archaeon]